MPHRIAVIGLGDAGYNMHLPALRAMNEALLVGVADLDAARLARATGRCTAPGYRDWREMLMTEKPEFVVVAVPPNAHVEICIAALELGANVICEKPFTDSVADADRIIAAAQASGRMVAVNHEFRHMPIFDGVLRTIEAEGPHSVMFAQVWQQVDLAPSTEIGWRGSMHNRVLHEAGVHLLDFVMTAFGGTPESVCAMFSDGATETAANADAIVSLTLRFSKGRIASVTMNRLAKGENHYFDARLDTRAASYRSSFGGRARISAGLHRAKQPHIRVDFGVSGIAWKETRDRRDVIARNPADPRMLATRVLLSRTLHAFETGTAPPCSAQWARAITEVIETAYLSAESGRVETVGA